jgi:hypothetical protein
LAALAALALAAPVSAQAITDHLTPDKRSVEVDSSSLPAGTTGIHVAVMADNNRTGIRYFDVKLSELPITPPVTLPWVDVLAKVGTSYVGSWASDEPPCNCRLQTIPGGVKEEPPVEKEPPPKEEEPPKEPPPPPPSEMAVGLDTGGWTGESAINDFAGSVRYAALHGA